MATLTKQFSSTWIDDQLDLYNYAIVLGDTSWQQQILERMSHSEELIALETAVILREELWKRFDEINQKVLALYDEMRASNSADKQRALLEMAWALKVERILIGKKIKSLCTAAGE